MINQAFIDAAEDLVLTWAFALPRPPEHVDHVDLVTILRSRVLRADQG
jgi:hypothetical protein